jgi:hypothetical protein
MSPTSEPEITPQKIIDGPRLGLSDCFTFQCGPERDCFGQCCSDVTIVLTPYDVLRLKRAVGMDSSDFMEKHTLAPEFPGQKFPIVILKMQDVNKQCPFLGEKGCGVYNNRPWACRMYPLGAAEPKTATDEDKPFHFVLLEDLCHGHQHGSPIAVRDWVVGQGAEEYELLGLGFKDLTLHDFWNSNELTPQQAGMFYMALYDIDRFRRFVFETRFLTAFEVDETRVEAIRTNDEDLLEFAMEWLRFSLFKEKTMRLRKEK